MEGDRDGLGDLRLGHDRHRRIQRRVPPTRVPGLRELFAWQLDARGNVVQRAVARILSRAVDRADGSMKNARMRRLSLSPCSSPLSRPPARGADAAQRRRDPRRRSRLRRRRRVQPRRPHPHTASRSTGARGDAVHRRAHGVGRVHADALRAAHGPLSVAHAAAARRVVGQRRCAHRAGPHDAWRRCSATRAITPPVSASGTSALRWAATPGATPDRTTNTEKAPVDWIDYAGRIADGPTHHGFTEFFGLPASLDMRDYVYVDGDRVHEPPTTTLAGAPVVRPGLSPPGPGRRVVPARARARRSDVAGRAATCARVRAARSRSFCISRSRRRTRRCCRRPRSRDGPGSVAYADFVAETDAAIGEVLQALEQSGAAKNTLVIFASDNGPAPIAEHDRVAARAGPRLGRRLARRQAGSLRRRPPGAVDREVAGRRRARNDIARARRSRRRARHDRGRRRPSAAGGRRRRQRQLPSAPAPAGAAFERGAPRSSSSPGMVRSRFATGGGSSVSRPDRAASARRGRVRRRRQGLPPVQLFDLEADPWRENESPGGASGRRPAPDDAARELSQERQEPVTAPAGPNQPHRASPNHEHRGSRLA